jgi:outer membrane protein assembly factor BamB
MKAPLLIAALSLALAGCSTVRSTAESVTSSVSNTVGSLFGSAPEAAKASPLVEFTAQAKLVEAWKVDVGSPGTGLFLPVVAGDALFAASEKTVTRVEIDSGRRGWRSEPDARLSVGAGASNTLAVVGNQRGELLAFDAATGAARWTAKLTSELAGVTIQADDIVIARTGDGLVRGLSAATGERVWQYSRSLPPLALRGSGGMVAASGVVYIGFAGGKLVALDAAKGAQLWEATVALPRGATELERIADVMGAPLVTPDQVCAAAFQGRVACFDRKTGASQWARDASSHAGIAADPDNLYLVEANDAVVQHALDTGRAGWRQDKLERRKLSPPLVFGKYVVVGDSQGYVHLLSREDGSFAARARVDGAITSAPVDLGVGFAVQTSKGNVVAFKLQ